jgi:hypothetical protein
MRPLDRFQYGTSAAGVTFVHHDHAIPREKATGTSTAVVCVLPSGIDSCGSVEPSSIAAMLAREVTQPAHPLLSFASLSTSIGVIRTELCFFVFLNRWLLPRVSICRIGYTNTLGFWKSWNIRIRRPVSRRRRTVKHIPRRHAGSFLRFISIVNVSRWDCRMKKSSNTLKYRQ